MADAGTATATQTAAATTTQVSGDGATKYLDRYDTPEAAFAGFANQWKGATGEELDGTKPLWGKDGHYPDEATAKAAYKAVQRAMTKAKPTEARPDSMRNPLESDGTKPVATDDAFDIGDVVAKAGVDWGELAKSMGETGDLTDDQYAKIGKARPGLGKGIIKTLAEAAHTKYQSFTDGNVQLAGGEESYAAAIKWARDNYSDAELSEKRAAFSAQTVLKNPALARSAFKSILFDMQVAGVERGTPRGTVIDGANPRAVGAVAKDSAEFSALVDKAGKGDKAAAARVMQITSNPNGMPWMGVR